MSLRKRFNSETGRFDWVTDEPDLSGYVLTSDLPTVVPANETDPVFSAWLIATPPLFTETDPLSLHLDQTGTPQNVINGAPQFDEGIKIGYSDWELKPIDINTLGLYVNGTLIQSWTIAYIAPSLLGQPIGLLLSLTYPA